MYLDLVNLGKERVKERHRVSPLPRTQYTNSHDETVRTETDDTDSREGSLLEKQVDATRFVTEKLYQRKY